MHTYSRISIYISIDIHTVFHTYIYIHLYIQYLHLYSNIHTYIHTSESLRTERADASGGTEHRFYRRHSHHATTGQQWNSRCCPRHHRAVVAARRGMLGCFLYVCVYVCNVCRILYVSMYVCNVYTYVQYTVCLHTFTCILMYINVRIYVCMYEFVFVQ